jgi:hypothetical protein
MIEKIIDVVDKMFQGELFVLDREKDKLTLALNKPKHPCHTRGYKSLS